LTAVQASDLLEAAQAGDDEAFGRLVEPHRGELHAHCYRMLASLHDADDALQDALLRAWRALPRFEGRSSLRTWLFTITTNACLEAIRRRSKRVLPLDVGSPADPHARFEPPVTEDVWVEPYPDAALTYEQREGVELAFVAALQHLPATQRAVLILREVLGFSAAEVAGVLETTVPAVNSALQRARAAVEARVPERSQQAVLREVGDDGVRELVDRYVEAWERSDVDAFVGLLAAEVAVAMPPLPMWYAGVDAVRAWAETSSMTGEWRWKALRTSANGQPALGFYAWDADRQVYLPFALNVLTLRGRVVSGVVAFIVRSTDAPGGEAYERFPELPPDAARLHLTFERFGLPPELA
jgi:RNA polymerase sigma-70 factor (ECF subfamily)